MVEVTTPVGTIEVREVHPAMLPPGRWWWMCPPSLAGRPLVLTSDPERLKRELEDAAKNWTPGSARW